MSSVVVDNSPIWFPTLLDVQLANYCSIAAAAIVWYDFSLLFTTEVDHIWRGPWSIMSTLYVVVRYLGMVLAINYFVLNANVYMMPSTCQSFSIFTVYTSISFTGLAIDRFENWSSFVFQMTTQAIMSMRIYAMYMRSGRVLVLLSIFFLATAGLGIALGIIMLGPHSRISGVEYILSGIHVCGVNGTSVSNLLLAYDILWLCTTFLQFALAVGRFVQHALETRRLMHRWQVNEFMKILVQDSTLYFLLNMISMVIFMISVWGRPGDSTYFAVITAYTQNQSAVLVPRLVISFKEHGNRDLDCSKDEPKEQEPMRFYHSERSQDIEMKKFGGMI